MAQAGIQHFEYLLGNKFFVDIDGPELQKGKIKVSLTVEPKSSSFEMKFHLEGTAIVSCDRCLDDMEIPVETDSRLIIKLGKEYAEESDEILVIEEDDGTLNIAWFLYEFVALALPMKHVHAPGKCNKSMSSKLKKHEAKEADDDDMDDFVDEGDSDESPGFQDNDPRWDALKDLL